MSNNTIQRIISSHIEGRVGRAMVYLIMALTLFQDILVTFLGLPGALRMLNDGFLVIAVLCAIIQFRETRAALQLERAVVAAFAVVVAVAIVSAICNGSPVLLVIWSMRQNFRGMMFLFVAVVFCTQEDVKRWFQILFWLQIPNAILVTVEYFYYKNHPITHIFQDAIGGLFGNANSSLNIYACILVCYALYAYLEHEMTWWQTLLTMVLSTYVSVLAEIRVVFLFYALVFVLIVLMAPNHRRKWLLVGMVAIMIIAALVLCERVYPGKISNFMGSLPKMWKYMSHSYGDIDPTVSTVLPRLGGFKIIAAQYLDGLRQLLLGIGFGNAENSSFSFLQSAFVREHSMWDPSSFMSQMTFLQTGVLGVVSLVMYFAVIAINGVRRYWQRENAVYQAVTLCMAVYSVALIWYDGTIRNDICYLLFWALAVGAICAKQGSATATNA